MDYNLSAKIRDIEYLNTCIRSLGLYIKFIEFRDIQRRVDVNFKGDFAINNYLSNLLSTIYGNVIDDVEELNKFQIALIDFKKNTKKLYIILSQEATDDFKNKLYNFFREKIQGNIILAYKIDSHIGGGVVLKTSFSYFDFSYSNVLNQNLDKIIEIIDPKDKNLQDSNSTDTLPKNSNIQSDLVSVDTNIKIQAND
ncbi:MAG: F0F1 ATP synthase subunit delta [Patescibacteria group bacterium]